MRSAFGIERLQQCPLVAYKIKFIYFSLVFFLLAAVSGLAQLHARPSAINECRPKRQWPKGKLPICKKPRVAAGPNYLSNRPGFPPQPVAINLKDRHKSDAFSTLIKDAYCPHYIFRFSAFLGLCSSSFSQFGSEIKNINKYLRRRSH